MRPRINVLRTDEHGTVTLCLGAAGALIGTRFLATPEAPASAAHKRAILASSGQDATLASTIIDIIWDDPWPGVRFRALRNKFPERWFAHAMHHTSLGDQ